MSAVAELDACPACAMPWAYEVDGKRYSHVIGHSNGDRIIYWFCPNCGTQWERNATIGDDS